MPWPLIAQNWRSFEVLLIDGDCADVMVSLARSLLEDAGLPHRIEIVERSSIYGAINHGIKAASGDWIYVLGPDGMLLSASVFEDLAPLLMRLNLAYGWCMVTPGLRSQATAMVRNGICRDFWSAISVINPPFIGGNQFKPLESWTMRAIAGMPTGNTTSGFWPMVIIATRHCLLRLRPDRHLIPSRR